MDVGRVTTRNCATVGPSTALSEAVWSMWSRACGPLPVVDEARELVGSVSLAQLARESAEGEDEVTGIDVADTLGALCQPSPEVARTADRAFTRS